MAQIDKTIEQVEMELHARANAYFDSSEKFWQEALKSGRIIKRLTMPEVMGYATLLAVCDILRIMEAK